MSGYESYIFLLAGILARVFIPYLVTLYKTDEEWDWKWVYLRGQLIGAAIVFLALPVLLGDLNAVASWDWQAAFLSGYGVAEIGRFVDKSVSE